MKHNIYGKHLSRNSNERTQLFRNLVRSLILHESINTTEAKAKAIKGLIDKLVTQAKTPTTRRLVSQFLVEKDVAEKLVKDIAPRLSGRKSGYTSIVRLGRRLGDGTVMVQMRLLTEAAQKMEKKEAAPKTETKEVKVKMEKSQRRTAKKTTSKKEVKK